MIDCSQVSKAVANHSPADSAAPQRTAAGSAGCDVAGSDPSHSPVLQASRVAASAEQQADIQFRRQATSPSGRRLNALPSIVNSG
jgi:hypothetical protein